MRDTPPTDTQTDRQADRKKNWIGVLYGMVSERKENGCVSLCTVLHTDREYSTSFSTRTYT